MRHVFFWEFRKLSLPFEEGQSFFCLCLGILDHSIVPGTRGPPGLAERDGRLKPFDGRGLIQWESLKQNVATPAPNVGLTLNPRGQPHHSLALWPLASDHLSVPFPSSAEELAVPVLRS